MPRGDGWAAPLEAWTGALLFSETSEEPSPRLVGRRLGNLAGQGIPSVAGGIPFAWPGGRVEPAGHADDGREILRTLDEAGLPGLAVLANLEFGRADRISALTLRGTGRDRLR